MEVANSTSSNELNHTTSSNETLADNKWIPVNSSVTIPAAVFNNISGPTQGLLYTVYSDSNLFPLASDFQVVGSLIFGVSVAEVRIYDLPEPVMITLEPNPNLVVSRLYINYIIVGSFVGEIFAECCKSFVISYLIGMLW